MELPLIRQSKILFLKEVKTEWRNRYAINGILVQLVSSVFIAYLCFQSIKPMTWNALYWVILLFSAVNAIARSFIQEREGRLLYFNSLVNPLAVLYSKMLLNILITIVVAFIGFAVFCFLLSVPTWDLGRYILLIALFSVGLGALFTTVSAIASKTKSGGILMPMLSFPLIIPLLLVGLSSATQLVLRSTQNFSQTLAIMSLIDVMILLLGSILFRFLWME